MQPVASGHDLCGLQMGKAWPIAQLSSESFRSSAWPGLSWVSIGQRAGWDWGGVWFHCYFCFVVMACCYVCSMNVNSLSAGARNLDPTPHNPTQPWAQAYPCLACGWRCPQLCKAFCSTWAAAWAREMSLQGEGGQLGPLAGTPLLCTPVSLVCTQPPHPASDPHGALSSLPSQTLTCWTYHESLCCR